MRWIFLLLMVCVIGFGGCGNDRDSNENKLNDQGDSGFDLNEDDASSDVNEYDTDQEKPDASDTVPDASNNPDDPAQTCATSEDCGSTRSVCDPMSQLCVQCLFDSQCGEEGGRCIDRVCQAEGTCEAHWECASVPGKPICNQAQRICVAACENSLDCPLGEVCDATLKQCAQCASNLDCGDNERCLAGQCEQYLPCQSDNQCTPYGLLCNLERGACNECENNAGCPNSYYCEEGRCLVEQCGTGDQRCVNSAVETCINGQFTRTAICQLPATCVQTGNIATCGTCTTDNQCAAGHECKDGVCTLDENAECSSLAAKVRLIGATEFQQEIVAIPLQTVEFGSGAAATDHFEWTIISRPANSRAQLSDNFAARPQLWLDLAGTYKVELVVRDANGIANCSPSTATVHAVPNQDIHIQLTWNTPAVPNPETGIGTDVDLHYRHPAGTQWNDKNYTVFWNARTSAPQWGSTPTRANKATLDIDDMFGMTTENINHSQPFDGNYEIGVHYYNDNGRGDTDATLRIYIQGELRHELLNKRLRSKQFWQVGSIQWPGGDLLTTDKVVCDHTLPGFPETSCQQ